MRKSQRNPFWQENLEPTDPKEFWPVQDGTLDDYEQSLIERHRQYAEEVRDAEA